MSLDYKGMFMGHPKLEQLLLNLGSNALAAR